MYEKRTLKVTGRGFISLVPDTTVISLNFTKVLKTYEEAVNSSVKDVNTIKELLSNVGFDRQTLKTTDYYINASYKQTKNKEGGYFATFLDIDINKH